MMRHDSSGVRSGTSQGTIFLCTSTYFRGGISSWAPRLVRAGRAAGLDMRLMIPWPVRADLLEPDRVTLLDHAPDLAGEDTCERLPYDREFLLANRRARQRRLAAQLTDRVRGATVILNNNWDFHGALARLGSAGEPPRAVQVVHGDAGEYYNATVYYAPLLRGMVAVSERIRERLLGWPSPEGLDENDEGVRSIAMAVVPCGVDLPEREIAPRPAAGVLRLVTACRLENSTKRVMDIPRIATRLRERGVSFCWDVLGDGPDRQALLRAVAEAALADCVRVHGWRSHAEVLETYASSHVYVQPSAIEGVSVAVMEAMACGVAPVITDISGTRELLGEETGEVGLAVAVGDVDAFAAALAQLARAPERLAGLRERACARAHDVLSERVTFRHFFEFLRTLPPQPGRWPIGRDPTIPMPLVGGREARLDVLPNALAVPLRAARHWWRSARRDAGAADAMRATPATRTTAAPGARRA